MRRFDLSSLRVQAILWTILPLAVVTMLVIAIGAFAYNEIVRSLVTTRDAELARVSAARLSENMVNYAAILETLANTSEIRSGTPSIQNRALRTAAEDVDLNLLATFDGGIYLLDRDGVLIQSVPYRPELNGRNFASTDFFNAPHTRNETFFSDISAHLNDSRDLLMIAVPINADRQFGGVVAGAFEVQKQQLGEEIRKLRIGDEGFAYLVDRNGHIIFHPQNELIGQNFSHRSAVQRLQRNEIGAIITDDNNETVVIGFSPVASTGWGLVINESWDDIIASIRVFQWVVSGALLVGLTLALVVVSLGTRRLTEPINALVVGTTRVASGEAGAPAVNGGTIREMKALADSFNEMAAQVARYRMGMQRYVAAITHSQEEERKRIARELHDETIQSLIGLGRRLEILETALENPIEAAKQLIQLQRMLNQTVAEVRQFSRDLRPLLLEDLGLVAALRQMLREMERRENLTATVTIEGDQPTLDGELEVTIYRIIQEALSNIRKHAQATEVTVKIGFTPGTIQLSVCDNGRGFETTDTVNMARRGSYGLMGIRERAQLVGGVLTIKSAPGEGTELQVLIPLSGSPNWDLLEGTNTLLDSPEPTLVSN